MHRRWVMLSLILWMVAGPAMAATKSKPTWPTYTCLVSTAQALHINPWIIVGVMRAENGQPGQIVHDSNGTVDMGPMQINSIWLKRLRSLGVTRKKLADNGCLNIKVGAAILSIEIKDAHGDISKAVGWYHSHTPALAKHYRRRVSRMIRLLSKQASKSGGQGQ